jgi:hypothetical protein
MTRFLTLAVLAAGAIAVAVPPAQAWYNFHLNSGIGFRWRAANNSYLYGLLRSGPAPYAYPIYGPSSYWQPPSPPLGCFPQSSAYYLPTAPAPTAAARPAAPVLQPTGYAPPAYPAASPQGPAYWSVP